MDALRLSILAGLLLATSASPLAAQDDGPECRRDPDGVFRCEAMQVEGTPQRPGAFYVLTRASLGEAMLDLRASFLHRIVREGRALE